MTLNDYFDKIICINLDKRTDKWAGCLAQFEKYGLTVERFSGHDRSEGWGNDGCTASHRGVLELICHHKWKRTLILEDDFVVIEPDFQKLFSQFIVEVPEKWEMLYLGGHYSCKPKRRINTHVIEIERMLTTSSYAVTYEFAKKVVTYIFGGAIDSSYFKYHEQGNCYIFQPRFMAQRESFSDIQQRMCNNEPCMRDGYHESLV